MAMATTTWGPGMAIWMTIAIVALVAIVIALLVLFEGGSSAGGGSPSLSRAGGDPARQHIRGGTGVDRRAARAPRQHRVGPAASRPRRRMPPTRPLR